MPNSECWHGHTSRQVGCVSCVIVFGVADGPSEADIHRPRYRGRPRARLAAALAALNEVHATLGDLELSLTDRVNLAYELTEKAIAKAEGK